jgi:sugar-specific transcriptional regulator TrmB
MSIYLMANEINSALKELGLSEKESSVFVALVELGDSPVNKITQLTSLNRVTVYPVINSLINKGFVSKFSMDRKTYFKAIEPKQILSLLKDKEEKIKSILPLLEERANKIKETTSIEIFKGEKAMSSFLEKLYSSGEKEFWAYGNGDDIEKKMINLSMNARNLRITNKIWLNVIVNRIPKYYTEVEGYKSLTKVKVNPELSKFNTYIIFGKKLVGIQEMTKELVGIIIKNEEIAKYHKTIYDLYLNSSTKVV